MNITPLYDRLIVQVAAKEEQSKSGILLSTKSDPTLPQRGEVVSAGEGRLIHTGEVIPLRVAVGDTVLFMQRSVVEIKDGENDYVLLREDDVLGKVNA